MNRYSGFPWQRGRHQVRKFLLSRHLYALLQGKTASFCLLGDCISQRLGGTHSWDLVITSPNWLPSALRELGISFFWWHWKVLWLWARNLICRINQTLEFLIWDLELDLRDLHRILDAVLRTCTCPVTTKEEEENTNLGARALCWCSHVWPLFHPPLAGGRSSWPQPHGHRDLAGLWALDSLRQESSLELWCGWITLLATQQPSPQTATGSWFPTAEAEWSGPSFRSRT